MATQTVEFLAVYGQTLTAKLYAVGSDTLVQTASAVTEQTNRIGVYRATFTDAAAGEYELHVATSGGIPVARWYVTLTLTTATFQAYDTTVRSVEDRTGYSLTAVTGLGNQTANITGNLSGSVGSVTAAVTVGTNNDKTGYTLTVTPPTAATIADAVWDETYSTHTTAGTFGKLMDILRKSNTVIEGTILASPTPTTTVFRISGADYPTGALEHAVLWMASGTAQEQNSPILTTVNNGDGTITVTLEEALVTAPVAGDTVLIDPTSHVHAIADIQAGLATAANQTITNDRLGFTLAVLAGTISDAQTAAETYAITLGANTFTVDFSGLDSSGNRAGQTLTKV